MNDCAERDSNTPPALGQINVVVRDMRRSLAFYRLLGLAIEEVPLPEWAAHHASAVAANGVRVEFDSVARTPERVLGRLVAAVPRRRHPRVDLVDLLSRSDEEEGIVEDPDGNSVGIMSPVDEAMRRPPPRPPA